METVFPRIARRIILLGAAFSAAGLGIAQAADSTVRLSDGLDFTPYVLGQLDEAGFAQSAPGGQAAGFNPRRLRLGGRLTVADQVRLGFIWDFGHTPGADGTLFEAAASYIGLKPLTATVGIFTVNFSLESMQGAGDYLMLERASIVTITRNLAAGIRRQGIQLQVDDERYNASIAGTAGRAGPGRDGDQRAVVGRIDGLPIKVGTLAVHTGVSGEWVTRPANALGSAPAISLSDQTELTVDRVTPALATGNIAARSGGAVGAEFGLTWQRLWVQGEYYAITVNRSATAGGGSPRFDGWYGQAAVTVLGRPREWNHSSGSWGPPKPAGRFDPGAGEFGAVELGVRYSTVDLNRLDIRGGQQHVASAIANWWPIEPVRLSLLYEHATIQGGSRPRTLDAVGGRAQIQF